MLSQEAIVGMASAIVLALASAVVTLYREFLAYRKTQEDNAAKVQAELKKQYEEANRKWSECEQGHVETKVDLAELKGRFEENNSIASLIQETLSQLSDKGGKSDERT